MENNPFAAVRNNALGTASLARIAQAEGVTNFVMVSTDKAVNPISIMGASKRVAELALLSLNNPKNRMSAVRLANVLGSQGSVVPTFLSQISRGGPVTVTHPDVSRYFLTIGRGSRPDTAGIWTGGKRRHFRSSSARAGKNSRHCSLN